jgi:hypothetical protein
MFSFDWLKMYPYFIQSRREKSQHFSRSDLTNFIGRQILTKNRSLRRKISKKNDWWNRRNLTIHFASEVQCVESDRGKKFFSQTKQNRKNDKGICDINALN